MAAESLPAARQKLCDVLCDYQGSTGIHVIVVFDAHLVEGGMGNVEEYHNITVVYTKEAETADHYIEQTTANLVKESKKNSEKNTVTVATSDRLEQIIILSHGARRMSARDLMEDVECVKDKLWELYRGSKPVKNNTLAGLLDAETARKLDAMRYQ